MVLNQVRSMLKQISYCGVAAFALLASQTVIATSVEESIKEGLTKRLQQPVTEVRKTPFDNLYEVRVQGSVVYTDAARQFVIFGGQLYDLEKNTNLTELALEEMNRVDIDSLPLDKALKMVYGDGKNRLVTFEDPNCPWCKRLQAEFEQMDVTVYTFVTPILSPDSFTKTENILCAKDPVQTWKDWMAKNISPKKQDRCELPINEVLALMQHSNVAGTPAIFFDNGRLINGFADAKRMRETMQAKAE